MAMTISDDERREVAARLRALKPWWHSDIGDPILREEFEEALGLEYVIGDSYDAVGIRRMADLIDRPTRCMKMINNDERRKEVQRLCAMAAVPSYELVSVRPSDLMKWANLIAHNDDETESYCSDNYDDFPIEYVGRTRYTTRCESKILNSMTYNDKEQQ